MNQIPFIENIFTGESPIYLNQDFLDVLDNRRKMHIGDKRLLDSVQQINFEKFDGIEDGRFSTYVSKCRLEGFFHKGTRNKLYVILGGARTRNGGIKRDIPVFSRWSWYSFADYSWISLEDPMYYDYPDLLLGWFYGNQEVNYRECVSDFIRKVVDHLGIPSENVVFYGSSGGGTAAIHVGSIYGNCCVVSINGQINFEYNRKDIEEFKIYTGIDLHLPDKWKRNDIVSLLNTDSETKYLLIENCRSKWDLDDHLKFYVRKTGNVPQYGLSSFDNLAVWIYEAEGNYPHSSFENVNLFFAIDFLCELMKTGQSLRPYQQLFLLFNEFWYGLYDKKPTSALTLNKTYAIPVNNANIFNSSIFINLLTIDNLEIKCEDEKYHCYKFMELKNGGVYRFILSGISSDTNVQEYTVGLFDFGKKQFIDKKNVSIHSQSIFSYVIEENKNDLAFCVFCGIHGNTNHQHLFVNKLVVEFCGN